MDLELVTPHMVWKPELCGSQKGSVQALVERCLMAFLEVGESVYVPPPSTSTQLAGSPRFFKIQVPGAKPTNVKFTGISTCHKAASALLILSVPGTPRVWQVGALIKRLDTGEGSYAKELEEDYDVAEQLDQVVVCHSCFDSI